MKGKITAQRSLIYISRIVSLVFTPFYLPLVGLSCLFFLSYLNQLPLAYRLQVLLMVWFFTIIMPTVMIRFYRNYHGWTLIELGHREKRMVPYVISILCYITCLYIMRYAQIPRFITGIVSAALLVQVVCAIINVWWKISTHMAAIGGVMGALIFFAEFFAFNPTWWICLVLIVAGLLGTARIILRQHTLSHILGGFAVGLVCAFTALMLL